MASAWALLARVGRGIKGLVNIHQSRGTKSAEQLPSGLKQKRMMPMGDDVQQRPKNERAMLDLRMRQHQLALAPHRARTAHTTPPIVEDIDIERACTHARPRHSASRSLKLLDKSQQRCRRHGSLRERHGVEIAWLASPTTNRFRGVEVGAPNYLDALFREFAARSRQGCARAPPQARHVAAEREEQRVNPVRLRTGHLLSTSGGILPRSSLC